MSLSNLKTHWREFTTYDATVPIAPDYSPPSAVRGAKLTYRFSYDKNRPIPHRLTAAWSEILFTWGLCMFFNEGIAAAVIFFFTRRNPLAFVLVLVSYTLITGLGFLSYAIKDHMKDQARSYHAAGSGHVDWRDSLRSPPTRSAHVYTLPRFLRLLFSKGD